MNTEQDKEAENWLDQFYEDLATEPLYQKSPEDIPDRVAMEIRGYAPEIQQAVRRVIGKWLQSPDPNKVDNALDLAYRLKTTEHVPILDQLHEDIRLGRSSLPSFWHTSSREVAKSVTRVQLAELQSPLGTGKLKQWATDLMRYQGRGARLTVELALEAAKDRWFDVVVGRDETGKYSQVSLQIIEENITESWREVYGA